MQGAFWGMLIAQVWGLVRFVLDFVYPLPGCDEVDDRPGIVKDFHAYYHTFSQILLAFLAAAVISLLTPEGEPKEKVSAVPLSTSTLNPAAPHALHHACAYIMCSCVAVNTNTPDAV